MYSCFYSKRLRILLVVLLVAVVVFFGFFSKKVKNFFYSKSEFFQEKLWSSGSRTFGFFNRLFRAEIISQENKRLKEENQKLLQQIVLLRQLREENEMLREALNLGIQKEFQIKLADVLGQDVSKDTILINKGSEQGIKKGMSVITQNKVLIGKVEEVNNNFCRVVLISDPSNSFPVELEDGTVGLAKGQGNQNILLEKIPHNIDVKEGETVVTNSLGGLFPKGLLVGKVKEVKKTDISPFQKIKVSLLFDLGELRKVFIITRY